jgi:hypothetical protein
MCYRAGSRVRRRHAGRGGDSWNRPTSAAAGGRRATYNPTTGVGAIVPTSIVVGLIIGTEGTKAQVESGE